jgi:hypothetical protein
MTSIYSWEREKKITRTFHASFHDSTGCDLNSDLKSVHVSIVKYRYETSSEIWFPFHRI